MNKHQMLELLKLLSALESWSFSTGKTLPDYLHESLARAVEDLTGEILDDVK